MARSFKKKGLKGKKKRISKSVIFAIIIGAVMILGTAGFGLTGGESQLYNGFKIIRAGNFWMIEEIDEDYLEQHPFKAKILKPVGYPFVPKRRIYFSSFPSQLEDMDIDAAAINRIKSSRMLYISFYPNVTDTDAQYIDFIRFQLSRDLIENFKIYAVQAKTIEKYNSTYDKYILPVIDCRNATPAVPVVLIKNRQNQTELKMENNCIIISSTQGYDLVILRDRITYGLLGVIE